MSRKNNKATHKRLHEAAINKEREAQMKVDARRRRRLNRLGIKYTPSESMGGEDASATQGVNLTGADAELVKMETENPLTKKHGVKSTKSGMSDVAMGKAIVSRVREKQKRKRHVREKKKKAVQINADGSSRGGVMKD